MHSITASELKKNSTRLQDALRGDLLITKRQKPFVVVIDYEKYINIKHNGDDWSFWQDSELDNFGKIAIGLSRNNFEDSDEDYSQW